MGTRPLSPAVLTGEPRICVTRRIPEPALALLRGQAQLWVSPYDRPLSPDELRDAVADCDAVVTLLHDRVDAEMLDAAGPRLRCVANVAVGYDNIDLDAAASRKVTVTNTPGVLTDATADLAIALILALTRRVGEGERLLRSDTKWAWHMFFMLGTSLRDKTLGIVGLGDIGRATAARARAFGLHIAYHSRKRASRPVEYSLGRARFLELDELLAVSDFVSLHCPLTAETHHLINAERLRRMRPDAYLINTARGPIVDEAALVTALQDEMIAGAALDVFEDEPTVHPGLRDFDNVVLTPHLGSATTETRTEMALLAARNALAVVFGEAPLTRVDHAARV